MLLHYQQRILPRFFSVSSSNLPFFHSHLFLLSSPSRFFSLSSSSAAADAVRPLIPDEPVIEIPLDKLFVPPEVELPAASASVARGRILKGSNIVLGSYSRDAQVSVAEFVKSSTRTEDCPADGLPEFALVGRSNVGKSSLLNSLVRRKRLALTSKKPGKTQCINHFRINDSWYLVDLPGFGYASAPQELRTNWDGFTKEYFLKRETLVSVFLLIDASIPPKKIDLEYSSWLGQNKLIEMVRTRGGHSTPAPSSQRDRLESSAQEAGYHRLYVGRVVNKSFVDGSVMRDVVKDLKSHITGPWTTFDMISQEERKVLWELFEAHYSWPIEETPYVRAAWEATQSVRHT